MTKFFAGLLLGLTLGFFGFIVTSGLVVRNDNESRTEVSIEGYRIRKDNRNTQFLYDEDTGIVYFNDNTRLPYLAPNGLPYKYNTETKQLEMIEKK